MLKIAQIKDLRTVTIEGRTFFGSFRKKGDEAVIENSLDITSREMNEKLFLDYILKENAGELNKPLKIEGAFVSATQEMNDTETFKFEEMLRKTLHLAAKATKNIQNEFVRKHL